LLYVFSSAASFNLLSVSVMSCQLVLVNKYTLILINTTIVNVQDFSWPADMSSLRHFLLTTRFEHAFIMKRLPRKRIRFVFRCQNSWWNIYYMYFEVWISFLKPWPKTCYFDWGTVGFLVFTIICREFKARYGTYSSFYVTISYSVTLLFDAIQNQLVENKTKGT
jgi:hypothetical protein